jgi:chromosome segregation ATPase
MTDRDSFAEKLKTKIDEWNSEIAQVENRLEGASEHARIETEEKLAELRRYRDEARAKLSEIQEQSENQWQETRSRAESAWTALSDGFSRAMDSLRGRGGS